MHKNPRARHEHKDPKKKRKKEMRPAGHSEDVTVSVYGGKRGAGANSSGRPGLRCVAQISRQRLGASRSFHALPNSVMFNAL